MITDRRPPRGRLLSIAPALLVVVALAACASPGTREGPAEASDRTTPDAAEAEVAAPRIVATYDGGVLVLEGDSLEVVDDIPLAGFLRVNPAGDGRRVLVSTDDAFRVLDTGVRVEAHGDHDHYYAVAPELTDLAFPASHPGHVTTNADTTALFADGTGEAQLYAGDDLRNARDLSDVDLVVHESESAHHGVVVPLADGALLTTVGDETSRSGAAVLDAEGSELARTDACPGVHGAAVAAAGTVMLGCEDGAIVWSGGAFSKARSADPYGRIGNPAGSAASPVVLGDYKVDPDADLERPTRVSLIDTGSATIRLVDLGTSYSFRSLARGPLGEALVLGTDGAIHVLDPDSGETLERIEVVEAWTEPTEWQQPRPAIEVHGHRAYVTDPAASSVHVVDLDTGTVTATAVLPRVPNELSSVGG
ncbi:zinc metallochaperone AztD [Agromyces sp. CF514]|uniref:zinc metallochaperone AztD n=1 Tax=Agromyces sp. CF514 TaxID=1881031 RepID=UPI000B884B1F|nr:zinc metallochaperone AztD [Agromyces sp. CF514]